MQVDSIISNTISQDIRLKGHQSIRFAPDGFSVLISDASYRPIFLKRYTYPESLPSGELYAECVRILDENSLLTFEGETVLILDSLSATLVPKYFYHQEHGREMLQKVCPLDETDRVVDRLVKNRTGHLFYAIPRKIDELAGRFTGKVHILHVSECLISLSDQVKSSDHQRGVVMAEVQQHTLDILIIKEDHIKLLNRYSLNDPSDFIYHVMNSMKQLGLDRESIPVYLSGIIHDHHELYGLLGKYVRNVLNTPYYLEELSRENILRFMILSEGSKCA
jgi:hypothetical protein